MSNTTATAGRHKISGQPHFAKAIRSQQCTGNHANQLLTRCAGSTVLKYVSSRLETQGARECAFACNSTKRRPGACGKKFGSSESCVSCVSPRKPIGCLIVYPPASVGATANKAHELPMCGCLCPPNASRSRSSCTQAAPQTAHGARGAAPGGVHQGRRCSWPRGAPATQWTKEFSFSQSALRH